MSARGRLPAIGWCALESSQLGELQAFHSNVLYYDAPWDPLKHTESTHWKGIDSFISFHVDERIKLFAFQNTLNFWKKGIHCELIERLKALLENQHAIPLPALDGEDQAKSEKREERALMPNADVDVFFLWIVRPEHVEPFMKQTVVYPDSTRSDHDWTSGPKSAVHLPYNTGVVSIADLLLSVTSALDEPPPKKVSKGRDKW
ncbi:hypothetical protein BLNAU_11343 [Blattamonas nauphoetae]|uniref:Uncharacterized protein n=1 Tax=Blattamonas nauphoetae TaxID=2049346 RepID=A0ABQ9XSL2_9EUKA|nr:hypothetical protein BLNAU_11343 [Blattamonas nauphoetae]